MYLFFQCICLGKFDPEWQNLPPRSQLDTLVLLLAILVHTSLVIPIYVKRRQMEAQDNAQNGNNDGTHMAKSLESFFSTCIIMVIGAINLYTTGLTTK